MRLMLCAICAIFVSVTYAAERGAATPQALYERLATAFEQGDAEAIRACYPDLEVVSGINARLAAERIITLQKLVKLKASAIKKFGEEGFKAASKGTVLGFIRDRDPGFAAAAKGTLTQADNIATLTYEVERGGKMRPSHQDAMLIDGVWYVYSESHKVGRMYQLAATVEALDIIQQALSTHIPAATNAEEFKILITEPMAKAKTAMSSWQATQPSYFRLSFKKDGTTLQRNLFVNSVDVGEAASYTMHFEILDSQGKEVYKSSDADAERNRVINKKSTYPSFFQGGNQPFKADEFSSPITGTATFTFLDADGTEIKTTSLSDEINF